MGKRIVNNAKQPEIERFMRYIEVQPNGCWLWEGSISPYGYGCFEYSKGSRAHRFAYEIFNGEIAAGLTIDHLCRNRACVNPQHLESVTNRENILRGVGIPAQHARKTHCPKGHSYDDKNTRIYKGSRVCRECHRLFERTYRETRRIANDTTN